MKKWKTKRRFSKKICIQPTEYCGSVCLRSKFQGGADRAKLLRETGRLYAGFHNEKNVYIDAECKAVSARHGHANAPGYQGRHFKPKILLFKNIFNSADKEQNRWFSPGALYLASALKKSGFETVLSDSKISLGDDEFVTERDKLEKILNDNPDINFIGISLCEDFFEKVKELVRFLRKKTRAFIGVGGVMPTLTPEHVFVHLEGINFLVRGAGEEIFPQIARILDGNNIDSLLKEAQVRGLLELSGFLFQNNRIFIYSSLNKVNKLRTYDHSLIDFSFLHKENLTEGINFFTSRGCFNRCFFCTSPGHGEFIGKSFQNLRVILKNYHQRLKEIFKGEIPLHVFKLSFNDDDFLADSQRVESFFPYLKITPFRINFFQTGINSFFKLSDGKYTDKINQRLLQNISPVVFSPTKRNIYIGTENFCDSELRRLNKGYDFSKIERVVEILSQKKIYQVHHLIASNHLTTPEDILDNLLKIAIFRVLYGDYFNILIPVNPYLVSLYPSFSYRIALMNKREKFLNIKRILSIPNYPEYNYPLVKNDIPINSITKEIIPLISELFLKEKDYVKVLDTVLFYLLLLQRKTPSRKLEIKRLIENYKNYPEIIYKKTGHKIENDRNNLQLMITRRCQLRCKYCPVIKKNEDMEDEIIYRSIDLLFTSTRENLRLDFTGGEPLLRFDLVKKSVEYAKKLAKKKSKSISFYLVTNLIALDEQMADFLARENFFLELSLDGKEKNHNLYKIGKNPEINPYRLTTQQLSKIFSRKINNYVVMVVTPATVTFFKENFYHLLKLGFRKISINYALGQIWSQECQKEFVKQMDKIRRQIGAFVNRGIISLTNLESRNEPAILNSEIMVDTDGEVYFLTDWLFEKVSRKRILPLGKISDLKNLNEIFLSKFRTLFRLFECYGSTPIEKIIINNIEMGNLAEKYFDRWKEKSRQF